ncbi:MAG TPA: hypothetical protein VET85_09175 [Stellaceae bacterium]|nr:hypothetical protein [Stellaceae bacterium]
MPKLRWLAAALTALALSSCGGAEYTPSSAVASDLAAAHVGTWRDSRMMRDFRDYDLSPSRY